YSLCVFRRGLPPFPTRRSSDLLVNRVIGLCVSSVLSSLISHLSTLISVLCPLSTKKGCPPSAVTRYKSRLYAWGEKGCPPSAVRSEEHTSELQSRENLVCRLRL